MKKIKLSWALFLILALVVVSSCKKDDNGGGTPAVEDGMYVYGAGTALDAPNFKGLLKATPNEVGSATRAGLVELYIAVKAGADGFNLYGVVGGESTTFGPGDDFAEVALEDKISDEPREWFARGSLAETTTKFTVPEDGLYHIVYDATLNKVAVARVKWGIIGGATVGGWGGSTALTSSAFNLNSMTFESTNVILTAGDFKFRYSDGWKIVLDGELVRVNTNFGGAVDALVPGGANIANTVNGYYTVNVSWSLSAGTTATVTKTGDYTPPSYPSALSVVGAGTAYGWNPMSTNSEMHKCAGGAPTEGIFWKILYLEAGQGFKIAGAGWTPSYGYTDINEFDASGVTVTDLGAPDHNWSVATSGMYMVVINLRDNLKKVSIIAPEVYGMGDCFGGWTEDVAANKFTVNNTDKTLVSPAIGTAGTIRSYVHHAWIPSWWNSEFVINGTAIEYRNDSGNDPTVVAGAVGNVITYHFDDNTGTLATPPAK